MLFCNSKRQGTNESSSYSSEICAGWVATKKAIQLRYMLRSLGVPVKFATALCGNNLRMIISCTNPDSELKKKHAYISYHKLREIVVAQILNPLKVCKMVNRDDIFTKGLSVGKLCSLSDASYVVDWGERYTNWSWLPSLWLFPILYYLIAERDSLRNGQYSSVDLHVAFVVKVFSFCHALITKIY